jgi:dTMP kinase
MRGTFIVLEGIESDWLSDQAAGLSSWLSSELGRSSVALTREPSDGPIGVQLRMALSGRVELDSLSYASFFLADRMQHLYKDDGILDRLESGKTIIAVRYILSTYAYQAPDIASFTGQTLEVALNWLKRVNQFCPSPDITIFIDYSPEKVMHGWIDNGRVFVADEMEKLKTYRENYHRTITANVTEEKKIITVNGDQENETVQRECRTLIEPLITELSREK